LSTKRLTQEEVIRRVKEVHGNEIKVVGKYINRKTKIEFFCNKCKSSFFTTPEVIFGGSKCAGCTNNKKRTEEDVAKEVEVVGRGDYIYLGGYKDNKSKIKLKHKSCGNVFLMEAKSFLLYGQRCPKHRYERSAETNRIAQGKPDQKNEMLKLIAKRDNYKIIKGYHSAQEKLELICGECGSGYRVDSYQFIVMRNNCICRSESKGERAIRYFLEDAGVEFERQYRLDGCVGESKRLPFDFALLDSGKLALLIEFDGAQHFSPKFGKEAFERLVRTDGIKNDFCRNNNIPLVRVKYNRKIRFDNFSKQVIKDLVKAMKDIKQTIPSEAIQQWIERVETNTYNPYENG